jgi:uncharacterized coiled-coil protein SlyX
MTKEQKEELLRLSAKSTETGHQWLDWLEDLHQKVVEFELTDKIDELIETDEDLDKAQKDMDELYERMKKINIV